MLNVKLQYYGHLMWRNDSFEKTLMLWKFKAAGEGDDYISIITFDVVSVHDCG